MEPIILAAFIGGAATIISAVIFALATLRKNKK